ncbi:MAG: argininosuccinate synthase, partial [Prochlorococcus sp.]|nr:argininosuccinate synthase [Prochlorococcus sp.]
LHKGNVTVIGRSSQSSSLYMPQLATYGSEDAFDHKAAEGFIYIWGLPIRLWSAARRGGR